MIRALVLAALLASPASAATLISRGPGAPLTGPADPAGPYFDPTGLSLEFTSGCGRGGRRETPCNTVPSKGKPWSEAMPKGLNSQGGASFNVTVSDDRGFDHVWIKTRDANDKFPDGKWVLELEGATAELLSRQRNGAYHGWLFKLDKVVTRVTGSIRSRLSDGFSLDARVCRSKR